MSKMDNLRAMREARFEQSSKQTAAKRPSTPRAKAVPVAPAELAPVVDDEDAPTGLCGHRAISGRTCTRERGHAAKSHRYA
jgi:hypothetical protein